MMSNLAKRVLSGMVLVPGILLLIFQGGIYFHVLCATLLILLVFEWISLWHNHLTKTPVIKLLDIALISVGLIYITLAMYKFWTLQDAQHKQLMTFLVVWSTDLGAYIFGKSFGKTPLAPTISPNKTWEGFWGGVLICIISCSIVVYLQLANLTCYIDFSSYINNFLGSITLFSTVVFSTRFMFYSVAAHLGDLLESLAKRYLNVKDSSQLIPGHGGFLDRFDSFLAVCIAYYIKDWLHSLGVFF